MMPSEQFHTIVDQYAPKLFYVAKRCLHDDQRAEKVLKCTLRSIKLNDITDEAIILEIALCETCNEIWNLAINYKPKKV